MFKLLDQRFQNEITTLDSRSQFFSKHQRYRIFYSALTLLLTIGAVATLYQGLALISSVLGALAGLSLVLAFRADFFCKLFLTIAHLDRGYPEVAVVEALPASAPEPTTSDIVTPHVEGVENWFELKEWKVAEGDFVNAGDIVAELENDEIILEVEVMDSGTISLGTEPGNRLDSGATLATLIVSPAEAA